MSVMLLGDNVPCGTYVLRLNVHTTRQVIFGRFNQGKPVTIAAGDWVYVGSAMGQRGSASLARRLIRHATRTGDRPPHALHPVLINAFGSDSPSTRQKTLRWHIDYLQECLEVNLTHVIAIRSITRLEAKVAAMVAQHARVIEPGLGASDAPGQTHLLRLTAGDTGWDTLVSSLQTWFSSTADDQPQM